MEFMSAEKATLGTESMVIIEADFTITEMKSPVGEGGFQRQNTGHLMPFVVGIDDALA